MLTGDRQFGIQYDLVLYDGWLLALTYYGKVCFLLKLLQASLYKSGVSSWVLLILFTGSKVDNHNTYTLVSKVLITYMIALFPMTSWFVV